MTESVRDLLERAATLAPDRLDRSPVRQVARRRGRRRGAAGGLVLAAVVGLAVVVVAPELGAGSEVLRPAAEGEGTQFFQVGLGDGGRTSTAPGEPCLGLPGASVVSGVATMSPQETFAAVGSPSERAAVEECLRQTRATVSEIGIPSLRAVEVSVEAAGLGPLEVSVGRLSSQQLVPGRTHDLTLTNSSGAPVFVQDLGFGTVLETGLFAGIGCSASELQGEVVAGCFARYSPIELAAGEQRSVPVQLTAGAQRFSPLPLGQHRVDVAVVHRTTAPFRDSRDADGATRGTVTLTYDISGPSAPDVSRAAFLLETGPFEDAVTGGRLAGDPGSGCLWLEHTSGETSPVLLYSDTASVDFLLSPFRIVDGDRVLAVEGDLVELGGGFGDGAGVPDCPVDGSVFRGTLAPPG